MSANSGQDTGPEIRLRRALWATGLRGYRKNVKRLPGKPDLVFGRTKVAVFVHGCYWHRCPRCARNLTPTRNAEFWAAKFARNVERDRQAIASLEAEDYRAIVVWECEIAKRLDEAVARVRDEVEARRRKSPSSLKR